MTIRDPASAPRERHVARKAELEREADRLTKTSSLISTARLVTFVGAFDNHFARASNDLLADDRSFLIVLSELESVTPLLAIEVHVHVHHYLGVPPGVEGPDE